jgi:hypothetical protein
MKIKKLKVKPYHIIGCGCHLLGGGFYTVEYYRSLVNIDKDIFIGDLYNNIMKCLVYESWSNKKLYK